ncbi:MAG: hypothetical protein WBV90_18560, partial [Terrimicrobiaceae bacterium]
PSTVRFNHRTFAWLLLRSGVEEGAAMEAGELVTILAVIPATSLDYFRSGFQFCEVFRSRPHLIAGACSNYQAWGSKGEVYLRMAFDSRGQPGPDNVTSAAQGHRALGLSQSTLAVFRPLTKRTNALWTTR